MGEDHDTYGRWDENGEFNPFDAEPDDDRSAIPDRHGETCSFATASKGFERLSAFGRRRSVAKQG